MTKRAAIYARFSSDRQNDRSADDQITLCAGWAERQGIAIAASFKDEKVSGASTLNRPGLDSLLRAARLARFDTIICEDIDRLSRKQADLHHIRDELTFLGISIMTVSDGTITAMHAGLKGLMSEMFLTDLANKTRRGLKARVVGGNSGGGKSYGYDPALGRPGEHVVNPGEAEVVVRIFEAYVAGATPREIAATLNAERVPSPRGGKWNSSTLNGSKSRANGILQNRLYVGEIVWNRQRFIKDPATGKRVSRLNPESEWVTAPAEHLAIVDRDLFDRAQRRKAVRSFDKGPTPARPRHMLSGVLKCGCCGASYTVYGNDRIVCSGYRERGDCTNNRTLARSHVEQRVLAALIDHLADPDLLAEYVRTFHEELQARLTAARRERRPLERRVGELTRAINRIVNQVVDGTATKELVRKLAELENERDRIQADLEDMSSALPAVAFHPAAAERYRRNCQELRTYVEGVRSGEPAHQLLDEARKLIDRVVITPRNSKEPVDLVVHGLLAEFLTTSSEGAPCRGAMVAGAGFEPATFRL